MKTGNLLLVAIFLLILATLGIQQWQLRQKLTDLESELRQRPVPETRPTFVSTDQVVELQNAVTHLTARIADLERKVDTLRRASEQANRPRADLPPATVEFTAPAQPKRSWGPEQAAGAPDTHIAGDVATAWASREPDAGPEWLKLDYERLVEIAQIRVRETYNPGAIAKVVAILENGVEMVLWEGVEPAVEAPIEMEFNTAGGVYARFIKLYLETGRVAGWNEIDAVELIGRDGTRQWAKSATASSTYAER
jgi:hypothetical protein